MSSFDQEKGVARELADEQRQASIAEFFEKNKQMLGFGSKNRALVTAVKEGVDNSLDAAEEARILPDIKVNIERSDEFYTVVIEDNGPGIPRQSVPDVFGKLLYGSRFHREMQQRGQQGIGISAAVLYSQLTSGNPARVTSKTQESDMAYHVEVGIDTDENEPIIHSEDEFEWNDKEHGIRIELDMEANMRARKRLHRYIKNTSVVNPHATIELHEPDYDLVYDERPVDELPAEVEEIKPHPHGVELGTLMDMLEMTDSYNLRPFFKNEFTRVGDKTALSIIDHFKDIRYGRHLEWLAVTDDVVEEDYKNAIKESVNRKGKEQTDLFAEKVFDKIVEKGDFVSYREMEEAVNEAAKEATEETDKQFAGTVQDKAVESVWEVLSQSVSETVHRRVDEATVDRKKQELLDLISDEIVNSLDPDSVKSIRKEELEEIVSSAANSALSELGSGSFGNTAQEKVVSQFWDTADTINRDVPKISDIIGDRDICRQLLDGMKMADAMAPPKKCISPITEEHIMAGLKSRFEADFYTASTRSAKVANGKPFIVEAGIAYGGDIDSDGQIDLNRFANRVPLVYQQGACAMTKEVKGIRWNNYYKGSDELSQNSGSLPQGPMVLLVHIASTNVPFTSESKDAVANVPQMEQEIERAVREVARDLKDHLKEERTKRKRQEKQDVIGGLLADMTEKIENITDDDIDSKKESQARILNNIFVRQTGSKTVRATNYGGRKHDVEIEIETEDGTRNRTLSLAKGESKSASLNSKVIDFEVKSPDKPRVTTK